MLFKWNQLYEFAIALWVLSLALLPLIASNENLKNLNENESKHIHAGLNPKEPGEQQSLDKRENDLHEPDITHFEGPESDADDVPPDYVQGFPASSEDSDRLLSITLNSLDKGVAYMSEQFNNINLDGVIGTRIVEGQLKVLLRHLTSTRDPGISHDNLVQIRQIIKSADDVSKAATFFVKMQQPKYYVRLGAILEEEFWALDYPPRSVDWSLVTPALYPGEAMTETDSDDCLTELLGSDGRMQCVISAQCWRRMTARGYRWYSLSHQLFYLQIAQQAGCINAHQIQTLTDPLVQRYCANMLVEAQDIAKAGYPVRQRDLFMEQQALCGMAGLKDFFRRDWLAHIIGWQWAEGCWGQKALAKQNTPGRVKREEKVLHGGCESHRTAVAISALSLYARFLSYHITAVHTPSYKPQERV